MTWQHYLRTRTRQPEFLWRMVIWVLAAGIGLGFVAEKVFQPGQTKSKQEKVQRTNEAWSDVELFAEDGEWGKVWWKLPSAVYKRFDAGGSLLLAGIACACWTVFLWQAVGAPGFRSWRLWAIPLALALGVLSIWPTHFIGLWLEYVWNIRDSEELVSGLRFYVIGVGFREEAAKLLCVVPLLPLFLRLRDELAVLLLSGLVGLGFAFAENINYFYASRGTAAVGRFVTANPLHVAMTALAGLALYRAVRDPRGWGSHSLGVFGLVVFAHGLYDAFLSLPALSEYSLMAMIIFALTIYQFFRELRDLRPKSGDMISLSANFLLGVSVVLGATFVYLSATLGMTVAFGTIVSGVITHAVMVYLFLREMPETMVSV